MATVYTRQNNAISISKSLTGKKGLQGFAGPAGVRGKKYATKVKIINNNTGIVFDRFSFGDTERRAKRDSTGTVINYNGFDDPNEVLISKDIPSPFISTLADEGGRSLLASNQSLVTGDRVLNMLTGEIWEYSLQTSSFSKISLNIKGSKGNDNYTATEISFSNGSSTGFFINEKFKMFLCGHVIWDGKSMNSVKVLFNIDSQNNSSSVYVSLVNLGWSAGSSIDDIIIAEKKFIISGQGDNSSWNISSLSINSSNIPSSLSILGVFVMIEDTLQRKGINIKNIKLQYNEKISTNYKEMIDKMTVINRDSFYNTLSSYNIENDNELFVTKQSRLFEERKSSIISRRESDLLKLDFGKNLKFDPIEKNRGTGVLSPVFSFPVTLLVSHLQIR